MITTKSEIGFYKDTLDAFAWCCKVLLKLQYVHPVHVGTNKKTH